MDKQKVEWEIAEQFTADWEIAKQFTADNKTVDEQRPLSLANALAGVRERVNARGRQSRGPEAMSAVANVRAMPSQATRWRHVVETVGYRSMNACMCDGADLYTDLLEALASAALTAGVPLRDYVRAVLVQKRVLGAK